MMSLLIAVILTILQTASTAEIVSSTFLFNANQPFVDISVNNFKNMPDMVYIYALKARPGAKVSIYFLTVPTNNSIIELFDGKDANAAKVNTTNLNNIVNLAGKILPIKHTSTNENYFLRVTALPNQGTDFQAIATDFENNADCSSTLIYAVGDLFKYPTVSLSKPATSCVHILRVVDTTNNRGMMMNIQNYSNVPFEGNMYKGLKMVAENKLQILDNFYVTDRNVVVVTNNIAKFTISYRFPDVPVDGNPTVIKTGLQSGRKQTLMSVDYIPYRTANGITKQTFSIIAQEYVNRMYLSFLSNIGTANVQINIRKGADTVVQNYTQATLPIVLITLDVSELVIQYTGDAVTATGLYALVVDATDPASLTTVSPGGTNGGENNGTGGGKKDKSASNLFNLTTLAILLLFIKL